jgi:hypothetical protein
MTACRSGMQEGRRQPGNGLSPQRHESTKQERFHALGSKLEARSPKLEPLLARLPCLPRAPSRGACRRAARSLTILPLMLYMFFGAGLTLRVPTGIHDGALAIIK